MFSYRLSRASVFLLEESRLFAFRTWPSGKFNLLLPNAGTLAAAKGNRQGSDRPKWLGYDLVDHTYNGRIKVILEDS